MEFPKVNILPLFYIMIGLITAITGCQPSSVIEASLKNAPQGNEIPEGIPNFAKVAEEFYRGGQPTDRGFAELKKMGIRTVVSLRVLNSDRENLVRLDMQYFRISFKHIHPEDEDVVAFLKIVTDSSNYPVFVHCRGGKDRTGMMVAIYRIVIQDWTKDQALAEMKEFGFHEIWGTLQDYVEKLDVVELRSRIAEAETPEFEKAL